MPRPLRYCRRVWVLFLAATLAMQTVLAMQLSPLETILFTQGSYLEDLPGSAKLSPQAGQAKLDISMVAALIKDNSDGSTSMFGPLLAMRAGHNHSVRLQNELTAPANDELVGMSRMHDWHN
ncbi:hypothetical protein CVIRNUC_010200 [Coccomyxa viridis]|uniref:Extracellular protein n=1 Tax=Coccomyxa viridis TaxID=1274662 RepID=A0AAV1IIP9_9CHLO|nr:hypothetical protein CVIRNUC_010200 [Coccomyxa viridis]